MGFFTKKTPEAPPPTAAQLSVSAEAVINSIDDGLILIDANGAIQVFNPAATHITGWSAEEARGLNFLSVLKLVDQGDKEIRGTDNPIVNAVQSNQPVATDKFFLAPKNGDKINLDLSVSLINQSGGQGAVITFRDVTARKKQEAEESEFISTASHEMRTPITAIDGYLGLLSNPRTATIDDRARDYVTKAQASVKHLGQLFQDLLDTAKADDNRLNTHPLPIDASEIAREATSDLASEAQARSLNLSFAENTGLAPIYLVAADKEQLLEVLHNIIENAIKYTPQGSVTVSVDGDEQKVRFMVKDTGIGISAEDSLHIFQKFYRIDNSDTRSIGGTGLGLYLTKRLVDNMRGRVWVESTLGQGSTFFVELPRISEAEARLLSQTIQAGGVAQ
jgi:PAS domain S-box-containing protein